MFKEIRSYYTIIIRYGVYLLILLNILDIMSTYIGIKYFNAYEANENVAYLFSHYGMLLPMGLKILIAIVLGHFILFLWDKSEVLLSNETGCVNFAVILSNLNTMFILLFLIFVYFLTLVNNITIIYWVIL